MLDIQFSEDLWKSFNFTVTWFLKYLSAFIFLNNFQNELNLYTSPQ